MLIWDTTPIIKCVAEIVAKADRIDAAINWDELSDEKKRILTDAKLDLDCSISWAELQAEDGQVGHYVDIDGNIQKLRQAQEAYLIIVKHAFPRQDAQNTQLLHVLYDEE